MPDLHQQITELEVQIEELFAAAEWCRKIMIAARMSITAGGLLLMIVMFKLFRVEPVAFVAAITAVLAGIVLFGSNRSTLEGIRATIRAHETRRAQLINELGLQVANHRRPALPSAPHPRSTEGR